MGELGSRRSKFLARAGWLVTVVLCGCKGTGDPATIVEIGLRQDAQSTVRTIRGRLDGPESMEATTLLRITVPENWRVEKGAFAGLAVPTNALFLDVAPALIGQQLALWPRYPIGFSVHGASNRDCTTTDDLAEADVARAVAAINAAVGYTIFEMRPSHGRGCQDADVRLVLSDSIPGKLGAAALYGACGPSMGGSVRCYPHWLRSGEIELPLTAASAEIQHEFLHVLGLTHTCLVPSVMATEFSDDELRRCGLGRRSIGLTGNLVLERRLSAYDIAAIEILGKVRSLVGAVESRHLRWVVES